MYITYKSYGNDKLDKVDFVSAETEGCGAGAEGHAETFPTRLKLRPHKIFRQALEKRGNFTNMKSSFESTLAHTTNPFQCILVPLHNCGSFGNAYHSTSLGEPYFTHVKQLGLVPSGKQTHHCQSFRSFWNHSCQDGEACAHHDLTTPGSLAASSQTTLGTTATKTTQKVVVKKHFHGNHLCQGGEACTFQESPSEESDSEPDSDLLEEMSSSLKSNHPILKDIIQRNFKKLDISNTAGHKDAFQIEIDLQQLENMYGHRKINDSLTFTR